MNFLIAVDSGADLSLSYLESENLYLFPLTFTLNGHEIKDDFGKSYSHKSFYDSLRSGAMPTTSQVNIFTFKEQFTIWAKENIPVLYLAFSSGLSGTYNSACIALKEVQEEYPDAPITIIDTLAASSGVGLLVYHACTLRKQGKDIKEVADYIRATAPYLCHLFTVDDLYHLERGGRVSHASAFVGSLLQIKPVLYVNDEGKLIPYQKTRGRKKSLHALVDLFGSLVEDTTQPVMISQSDCEEDAHFVAKLLQEKYNVEVTMINPIGSVIGSHCGANVIALFFIAKQRVPNN